MDKNKVFENSDSEYRMSSFHKVMLLKLKDDF